MANLTDAGEQLLLGAIKGDYAGSLGFDRIGVYGSIGAGSDQLLASVQAITWGWTVGNSSIYILTPTTLIFSIPANSIVKGIMLFNSANGVAFGDEVAVYVRETPQSFVNAGTAEITSCTYNFDKIASY